MESTYSSRTDNHVDSSLECRKEGWLSSILMTELTMLGDILDKLDGQITETTMRLLYFRQMQLMDLREVSIRETTVTCSMQVA